MANYSNFVAYFIGEEDVIKRLKKEIESSIDGEVFDYKGIDHSSDSGYCALEPRVRKMISTILIFGGDGIWVGPYKACIHLAQKYKVELIYHDMESGCNFYREIRIRDGIMRGIKTPYISKYSVEYRGYSSFIDELEVLVTEDGSWNSVLRDAIKELSEAAQKPIECVIRDLYGEERGAVFSLENL